MSTQQRRGPVTVTDQNPVAKAFSADGAYVVTSDSIASLGVDSFNTGLVTSGFFSWTVDKGSASPGTFSVSSYKAAFTNTGEGGAQITLVYDNGAAIPAGQQLQWFHFVSTNAPLGGTTSPYVDPRPNDDTLPFYLTESERAAATSGNAVLFYDYSKRLSTQWASASTVKWAGSLFLAQWDGATKVSYMDGLQWGWEMKKTTQGSSSGQFVDPTSSGAVFAGAGTSHLARKTAGLDAGGLIFTPTAFDPKPGEIFKLGEIEFLNRLTAVEDMSALLDLDLSVAFDNLPEKSRHLFAPLSLMAAPNTFDPFASADSVSFTSGGMAHALHVYEGEAARADLFARLLVLPGGIATDKSFDPLSGPLIDDVTFLLELVGFGNVSGGVFVTETAVPEPPAAGLLALALALVAVFASHRKSV